MAKIDPGQYDQKTAAIRAGQLRTSEMENSEPIFASSSFVFDNAAQAAARFCGEEPGNVYSRFTNPTVRTFEERLAALEGTERCIATSSGMSAILSCCLSLLETGDHIVSSRSIFGTTVGLFSNIFPRLGITSTFVPVTDYDAWEKAIGKNTRLLFLETPTNPLNEIADIKRLANLAHDNDCLLVVDNCFCTPVLQRPFVHGADIVIHSATKYLDGQGRCIGGAVLGREDLIGEPVFGFLRTAGPAMSPFNAWVFLKGLETLELRMRAHCTNAQHIAEWLNLQTGINKVFYAGLPEHPGHELAARQQNGFGGIVSIELEGGRNEAWKFIDGTKLFSITANLGDTKSTITHPATTTHSRLTDAEREQSGISQSLIRLSIGHEHVDDVKADLEHALHNSLK